MTDIQQEKESYSINTVSLCEKESSLQHVHDENVSDNTRVKTILLKRNNGNRTPLQTLVVQRLFFEYYEKMKTSKEATNSLDNVLNRSIVE
jgi:hypothetical protein